MAEFPRPWCLARSDSWRGAVRRIRDRWLDGRTVRGRPLSGRTVESYRYLLKKAAEVPENVTLHDLRHAGATMAAQLGGTTRELMARLGHASPRAALICQHAAEERDHAIAAALDRVGRKAAEAAAALSETRNVIKVARAGH